MIRFDADIMQFIDMRGLRDQTIDQKIRFSLAKQAGNGVTERSRYL